MSYEENLGNQLGIDGAKILVWGAVGDKLKKLDKNRMLAIIQHDPDFYLSVIYNIEAEDMITKVLAMSESLGDEEEIVDPELPPELEDFIYHINKLDAIFLEATTFLHESNDMLATGSFITGEFEQKKAILKTMGRVIHVEGNNTERKANATGNKVNAVQITS